MSVLIFESGPLKGTTIRIEPDRVYTFGRDEKAEVPLSTEVASRVHAKLRGKDGHFYLKDSDSSNGTYVNDGRITGVHELRSGDRISIGNEIISFLDDTEAGAAAGRTLGGFQLVARLGRGGMGTVYRAIQKSLNREVALKILAPELARDQKFVEQFKKEARAAAQLNHPNIVAVYDVEEGGGLIYYAMEFMPGGTVEDRLNKQGPLPVDGALSWLLDAARGLQYAELKRIVHRDIKPDNLMLTDLETVKIADLGLALATHEGGSEIGIHGTPHFIAPEQVRGEKLDTRSDLYSLGATFFRMLTGKTPFSGENAEEILRKQVKDPAPSVRTLRSEIPEKVAAIAARLLEKDPNARFQTTADLIAAIELARSKRSVAATAALAVSLLVLAAGGAGWYLGWFGPQKQSTIVQQVMVTNQEDAQRAKEAEERAKKVELENSALAAFNDLTLTRQSIGDDTYLEKLRELADRYKDAEFAARVRTEIESLGQELNSKHERQAAESAALEAAISALGKAVDGALAGPAFADAYGALAATSYGSPEALANAQYAAALAEQRRRVDSAFDGWLGDLDRDVSSKVESHDFAAARSVLGDASSHLGAIELVPESESAARANIERGRKFFEERKTAIDSAEKTFFAKSLAEDRAALLSAIVPDKLFAEVRALRSIDLSALEGATGKLTTASHRAFAERLLADLRAYDATVKSLRAAIERGGLSNAKVKNPEKGGVGEILSLSPDGNGVLLEVTRGFGKSKVPVAFDAFDSADELLDLLTGRVGSEIDRNQLARTVIVHAAARLELAAATFRAQLQQYDATKGWSADQQANVAGVVVPRLGSDALAPLLTGGGALDAAIEKRLANEGQALEWLRDAFSPFQDPKATVRFGLAADQFERVLAERRDTLAFLACYALFDDGSRSLPLVTEQTP